MRVKAEVVSVGLRCGSETHMERVTQRLNRVLGAFKLGGVRPSWLDDYVAGKRIRGVNETTLLRYLEDLRCFSLDPGRLTFQEIQRRLSFLAGGIAKSSYRRTVITVKQVLQHLGREVDAEAIPLPKKAEPRVALLTAEEIQKLLGGCVNLRDRLLIEFLVELGCRRGEIAALKIKDVQFDSHTGIVWLRGKTGERRRRVYVSKADLIRYLEDHPHKSTADAPFWLTSRGEPLQYQGIYKIVSRLGWKILHRQIYPHMFRHTKATDDAKRYTDTEMMKLYGWKTSDQVRVYAHLSMRDIDEKDLVLHGIKPAAEASMPLIETRRCPNCQAENGPVAIYCHKCEKPISDADRELENTQLRKDVTKLTQDLTRLQGQFETILKTKFT